MKNDIAIIMCTWKRINNLPKTIKLLENQTFKNFDFFIWNNNVDIVNDVNDIIKKSKLSIEAYHSDKNIGGIGRFYYAKKINDNYKKIIFIDDDQIFDRDTVKIFNKNFKVKTIMSWWGWKCFGSYNNRIKSKHMEEANYCGTGGMIVDSDIFNNEEVFNIPRKYQFIEDLWLSHIGKNVLKWNLYGLKLNIEIIVDGKDQSTIHMLPLKNEFWLYINKIK